MSIYVRKRNDSLLKKLFDLPWPVVRRKFFCWQIQFIPWLFRRSKLCWKEDNFIFKFRLYPNFEERRRFKILFCISIRFVSCGLNSYLYLKLTSFQANFCFRIINNWKKCQIMNEMGAQRCYQKPRNLNHNHSQNVWNNFYPLCEIVHYGKS